MQSTYYFWHSHLSKQGLWVYLTAWKALVHMNVGIHDWIFSHGQASTLMPTDDQLHSLRGRVWLQLQLPCHAAQPCQGGISGAASGLYLCQCPHLPIDNASNLLDCHPVCAHDGGQRWCHLDCCLFYSGCNDYSLAVLSSFCKVCKCIPLSCLAILYRSLIPWYSYQRQGVMRGSQMQGQNIWINSWTEQECYDFTYFKGNPAAKNIQSIWPCTDGHANWWIYLGIYWAWVLLPIWSWGDIFVYDNEEQDWPIQLRVVWPYFWGDFV